MVQKKDVNKDENVFRSIYYPLYLGGFVVIVAVIFGLFSHRINLVYIFMGVGSIIMSISGYWQIKFKLLPGFPALTGGCAVAYGVFFILLFGIMGMVMIILTINPLLGL